MTAVAVTISIVLAVRRSVQGNSRSLSMAMYVYSLSVGKGTYVLFNSPCVRLQGDFSSCFLILSNAQKSRTSPESIPNELKLLFLKIYILLKMISGEVSDVSTIPLDALFETHLTMYVLIFWKICLSPIFDSSHFE